MGKATPIVSAGDVSGVYGAPVTVTVNVGGPSGITPSGTVTIRKGGVTIGSGPVSGGVASIVVTGGALPHRRHRADRGVRRRRQPRAGTTGSRARGQGGSTTTAKVKPGHPKADHKVKLKVVEGANGVVATGKVTIKVSGKKISGTLKHGEVTVKLGELRQGRHKAKVVYDGDGNVAGSKTKVKFTVS